MERNRVLNQIGVFFVTCLIVLLSSQMANAANQYIRDGATGTYATTHCDSWASDRACDDLPASLVRGDTYYIADGNYAGQLLSDAEDGEKYITIKKCPSSALKVDACQSIAGWNDTYGDGQAVFGTLSYNTAKYNFHITTGHYVIDGAVGSGNNPTSYGFNISQVECPPTGAWRGVSIHRGTASVTHVTVSHAYMKACGFDRTTCGAYAQSSVFSSPGVSYPTDSITISSCWMGYGNTNLAGVYANNWIVENNWIDHNWNDADGLHDAACSAVDAPNGQMIASNISDGWIVRGNVFNNGFGFINGAHYTPNINHKYYNNLIIGGIYVAGFGTATQSQVDTAWNWDVHHNTFVGVDFASGTTARGAVFPGQLTDAATNHSHAYNNIFYDCKNPRLDNGYAAGQGAVNGVIHDNNAYLACTASGGAINSADESAPQRDDGAANPFVDSANNDYRLKVDTLPINHGKTGLGSAYALDFAGVTRSATPTIGAYECAPVQSTLLVTSANGTVTSNPSGINCGSTCSSNYDAETSVTLTAVANSGYTFTGWSGGGCSGTGACIVTMTEAKSVTANYGITQYYLTVTKPGTGVGTVTGSDGLVNCGSTCSVNYESGKAVTLAASATSGSTFSGWSGGGCSGKGTCTATMTGAKSVTATFTPVYNLTVTKSVTGAGTITSSDGTINCGSTCSANYNPGTSETLTASANSGYTFTGWLGGGCSGTGNCIVSMAAATSVTATFATSVYNLAVTKSGTGSGTVTGSDGLVNCGSTCSVNYESGKSATLAASATSGSTFSGWSGGCSGTGTCTVNMTAAKSVNATFTKSLSTSIRGYAGTRTFTITMPAATPVTTNYATSVVYKLTVSKSGTGSGTVTSSPAGISCGATCSANYTSGTVTLAASANSGSTFSGWSGGCTGTGTCTVNMNASKSVTATFAKSVKTSSKRRY